MLNNLYYWLYNALLHGGALLLAPVWMLALLLVPKFRAGFWQKCGCLPKGAFPDKPIILHAVSVGEFNAARPLIDSLLASGHALILTNTTRTGHTLAAKTYPNVRCLYFPFDFPLVWQGWLNRLQPKAILVMETEIWPNLAVACHQRAIPLVMLNGRLSAKSFASYRRLKPFFTWVLSHYTALWMQSAPDELHILALGARAARVKLLGNLKFAPSSLAASAVAPELQAFIDSGWFQQKPVVMLASTHAGEDELLVPLMQELAETLPIHIVSVPRHPERFNAVARLWEKAGFSLLRRSELIKQSAVNKNALPVVFLLDTMGEVRTLMPHCTVVFLAGSLLPHLGGHNIMEPLQAGRPTLVARHMGNFASMLEAALAEKALIQVESLPQLKESMRALVQNETIREALSDRARAFSIDQTAILKKYENALAALLAKSGY